MTKLQDCYCDDTIESKQWYTKAIEELKNSGYSDKYIDIVTGRNNGDDIVYRDNDNQECSSMAHSWGEIYSKHAKSLNDESTQITYSEKRVNDRHTPLAHTTPVIYYPNHPVYDLDLPQGSLNRVGDNE